MQTYTTVEKAVDLVVRLLEANNVTETNDTIRARVYDWYIHSDVTDPEVLAACALEGKWHPGTSYAEMLDYKEWWFPTDLYNEISIWEIEEAQHDALWRDA